MAKPHEIPEIKPVLNPHDITGQMVTADALHTQRETARDLVEEQHAHDVLEVKGNQPTLQDALAALEPADFSPSDDDDR